MLILSGKNLGERQKELNLKVNEAAANNIDFEQIKEATEQSDVDKLFKIDLASKQKNIEYIIEVLKSGDSLYISRALKCDWMFGDEFSHIFNVDYLHHNVFPFMSPKMKKKLLTTLSSYVRNVDRAIAFCNYCMDMKLTNIAIYFIMFTSEDYKLDCLQKYPNIISEIRYRKLLKYFIGSSFTLANAYITTLYGELSKLKAFNEINYLYSVSNEKYLDMLEDHVPSCTVGNAPRVGLRLSKDIITKHKDRVLSNPSLYINYFNKKMIIKHSSSENAKIYVRVLLPNEVNRFWSDNFCRDYEYILNIIPFEERFEFIKKIFSEKYPKQPFEMVLKFYSQKYYRFMTTEQKEKWAQDQIASQKEILGIGNDYKWYEFINFETAFDAIRKLVMITPDSDKRNKMLNILIESAKTQRELEKLFKHYYDRHNNELQHNKEYFMDRVAGTHNVFEFDNDCWGAFNKIYQNLDVYSTLKTYKSKNEFRNIAFVYHVINKIDVPEALIMYIDDSLSFYNLKSNTDKLPKEKQEMVYEYLFNFFMKKFDEFNSVPYEDEVKYALRKYIYNMLDLLVKYHRTKDDLPGVVMKFIKLDWEEFKYHALVFEPKEVEEEEESSSKDISQTDLLRLLKTDASLLVKKLSLVRKSIEDSRRFHLGLFLKKLKIFFSNDISKEYLKFYNDMLVADEVNWDVARAACFGIFQLGENSLKVDIMKKYAPKENKINRGEIHESLLNIQEAICATAFYSRPPVPLKNMLMYVKGDYVRRCLPMFNYYSANLPLPLCIEFIEALLNKPLSVQKHGLRMAFTYFNAENLRKLVLHIWKKTKNVSLRLVIYKALYDKIVTENESTQAMLFETLKTLTLQLHQDDDPNVFTLLTSGRLPKPFISDYIDAAWTVVRSLESNNLNLGRKADIINYMCSNIESIRQNIVRPIIEEFVNNELNTDESFIASLERTYLELSKWDLIAHYIIYIPQEEDLQFRLELTKLVLSRLLNNFDVINENRYTVRESCKDFLQKLLRLSFDQNADSFKRLNAVFDTILQMIEVPSLVKHMYKIIWSIRLNIIARNALAEIKSKSSVISSASEAEKSATIKEELLRFGRNIGLLIKEFKEKNMYFNVFLKDIRNEVYENTSIVVNFESDLPINRDDLLVLTSVALMEVKATEMYLFALYILPTYYSGNYQKDYEYVLNEIKSVDDLEVSYKMYDKFVNSDFVPRAYLQL